MPAAFYLLPSLLYIAIISFWPEPPSKGLIQLKEKNRELENYFYQLELRYKELQQDSRELELKAGLLN